MRWMEIQALVADMLYVHDEGLADDSAIQELGHDPFEVARTIAWPTPEEKDTPVFSRKLRYLLIGMIAAGILAILAQITTVVIRVGWRDDIAIEVMKGNPRLVYELVHTDSDVCKALGGVFEGDRDKSMCILDTTECRVNDCTWPP